MNKTWKSRSQNKNALSYLGCLALVAASLVVSPVSAQESETKPADKQQLPTGQDIMAKHVQMSGGQQAFDKIKNRVAESTLTVLGAGLSVDLTTYSARPNKIFITMDSKLTGKIEKGTYGDVYWENSLTAGPVIHDGVEREIGLRDSTFERFVYWDQIYESVECVAKTKVGDADCYEVVLTPKKRKGAEDLDVYQPTRLFIDTKDYLIRKIQTVLKMEAGEIKVTAYPEDYKVVDGIKIAHKLRMELIGQKREFVVNSVKHNVDLPADQFDPPEEVKKLLKK